MILAIGLFCIGLCSPQLFAGTQQVPSETLAPVLHQSWQYFKKRHLIDGQRVESNHYQGTITEGQSYAMLKALRMNEPETFDRVWQWTKTQMKRPHDHLLGWRWGRKPDGQFGLISEESATDADQDIAYALLLAGEKWNKPPYTADAMHIIRDLWRISVIPLHGKYYLSPGTWEGFRQEYVTLNPSYFAPYVYRKFAQVDEGNANGWKALANNIYPTLEACSDLSPLSLPPNWCAVGWQEDKIMFSDKQGPGSRDFGYDAVRVFWRMAMDAKAGSPQAQEYLKKHDYLLRYWKQHKTLPAGFDWLGKPWNTPASGFTLSAAVAQSHVIQPHTTWQRYTDMLASHYRPEGYWFNSYDNYLYSIIWLHLDTLTP